MDHLVLLGFLTIVAFPIITNGLPNPVAQWPLTPYGHAYCPYPDTSGNGLNLVHYEAQPIRILANPSPAPHLPDYLYYFPGDEDTYLLYPNSPGSPLDHNKNITFSLYLNVPLNSEDFGVPFSYYTLSGGHTGNVQLYSYHTHVRTIASKLTMTVGTLDEEEDFTPQFYSPGVWVHVTFTFNSGVINLYRDGVLFDTKPAFGTIDTSLVFLAGKGFQGFMYCLQVYDAVLTEADINETRAVADTGCGVIQDKPAVHSLEAVLYNKNARLTSPIGFLSSTSVHSQAQCISLCDVTCECLAVSIVTQLIGIARQCEMFMAAPNRPSMSLNVTTKWKTCHFDSPGTCQRKSKNCK